MLATLPVCVILCKMHRVNTLYALASISIPENDKMLANSIFTIFLISSTAVVNSAYYPVHSRKYFRWQTLWVPGNWWQCLSNTPGHRSSSDSEAPTCRLVRVTLLTLCKSLGCITSSKVQKFCTTNCTVRLTVSKRKHRDFLVVKFIDCKCITKASLQRLAVYHSYAVKDCNLQLHTLCNRMK